MAGFVDVVLRGLILVLTSVALGGVAWLRFVLRAEPHVKPDAPTALALRAMAAAGAGAALAQATVVLVGLASVADAHGTWPLAAFFETTFALTASARVMLAAAVAALALMMTRRAAPRGAWTALAATATLLVASSAVVSHAVARVEWRAPLIAFDSAHQVAAALWVGGLAHLVLLGVAGYASPPIDVGAVARRFSTLAFRAMAAIVLAGLALTFAYVGDLAAFVGTAYGVMVLSKVALLVPALALAYVNMRAVRRASAAPGARLFSFVEVELGLGITILFAAASLTSLPPAVDVTTDRASVGEVAVGLRVPVAVRGGRRAPADALARDVQPEGGVPHRGHPRAARDPRRVRGLGPVARGATAGGGPRARLDLARLLHRGGTHPALLSRGVMAGGST